MTKESRNVRRPACCHPERSEGPRKRRATLLFKRLSQVACEILRCAQDDKLSFLSDFVIRHSSFVIHHSSFIIRHFPSFATDHDKDVLKPRQIHRRRQLRLAVECANLEAANCPNEKTGGKNAAD